MRNVERDDAPAERAAPAASAEREQRPSDVEDDDEPRPGERVRAVEEELREPLLVGPRRALRRGA